MNQDENEVNQPDNRPQEQAEEQPREQPETQSAPKRFASRRNLLTAGLVAVALLSGLAIGTLYANKQNDDSATDNQQAFSSRANTSNGAGGNQAAGSTAAQNDGKQSSGTGSSAAGSSALAPSGGGSTTTSNGVTTTDIAITGNSFSPATVTVKKGSRVTWTNKDNALHALDRADGGEVGPHSQQLAKGESYTYSYGSIGTFKYLCILHPNMTGTVTVID